MLNAIVDDVVLLRWLFDFHLNMRWEKNSKDAFYFHMSSNFINIFN